jgi:YidC/Oxa1 family membrane protein insertase
LEFLLGPWNSFLVFPIRDALLWLSEVTGSGGLAIILFTIIVRTAMLPLGFFQVRSQKAMLSLQPRLREIQRKYEGDKQRQAQEQMALYREVGVNPVAGCLPMVVQMPIWLALYSALVTLANNVEYGAFHQPFLWISNLAAWSTPSTDPVTWPLVILPVLTAGTQWVVQRMSMLPTADPQQQTMNRTMEFMPIMFLFFSFNVPSGLTLYWVISNVYSIFQQYFFMGWGTLPVPWNRRDEGDANAPANRVTPKSPNGHANSRPAPRSKATSSSNRRRRK